MFYVEVVNSKTEEVIEKLGPMPERKADRTEDGMNINLNHEEYFTRIVPSDTKEKAGDDTNRNVAEDQGGIS